MIPWMKASWPMKLYKPLQKPPLPTSSQEQNHPVTQNQTK